MQPQSSSRYISMPLLAVLFLLTNPVNSQALVDGYIPNSGDNNLTVLDTSNNTTSTIPVGLEPTGVATGPSGQYLYVTNKSANTVSQIDLIGSNDITHSVGSNPVGVAISPDGTYVYVANQDGNLSIINTSDNSIETMLGVGASLYGVAANPDGNFVYVTDDDLIDDKLHVIDVTDPTNRTVVTSLVVGQGPRGVAVSPSGYQVVVANSIDNTVSVISTTSYAVSAPITVGTTLAASPFGVAIANDSLSAFVTNPGDNSVSRIDLTNSIVTDIPLTVGDNPQGISLNAYGNLVYVANNINPGTVKVINVVDNTVSATVFTIGNAPVALGKFFFPEAPSALSTTLVNGRDIDLVWADNSDAETGFKIERRKYNRGAYSEIATVGPTVNNYNDPDLDYYANYYYRVRAYNADGNTVYSNIAFSQTVKEQFSSSCFIATAAYGSVMEPQVRLLRNFRDRFLVGSRTGQSFLDFYYENSPPIARFIADHDLLRFLVRWSLLPLVVLSWLSLQIGFLPTFLLAATTLTMTIFILLKRFSRQRP